jgi:hypothetical protein
MLIVAGDGGSRPAVSVGPPGFGAGAEVCAGGETGAGVETTDSAATVGAANEIDAGATGAGLGSGGGAAATDCDVVEAIGAAGVAAFSVSTIDAPLTGAEDAGGTGAGACAGTGSAVGSAPDAAE